MKESLVRRFIWFMFISVFSEEWRQTETNKQLNNSTNINGKNTVYIGGFLLHKSAIETMFILGNRPRSWHSSLWPSGPPARPSSFIPMRILPTHVDPITRLLISPGMTKPVPMAARGSPGAASRNLDSLWIVPGMSLSHIPPTPTWSSMDGAGRRISDISVIW